MIVCKDLPYLKPMDVDYQKQLERNIVKFSWYKIFTKRVYLPVIAVFLIEKGMVSVEEIALIAGVTIVAQLLLQMPGGYFADAFGNAKAMKYSSLFITVSPLMYIFMPNFWGGLLASVLFFGGYAFQQGSGEAFMHDTLTALGREKEYAKVMGRAQSYGLVGSLILTAVIPATYAVNVDLPFILGFLSLVAMTVIIYSFEFPKLSTDERSHEAKNPIKAVRSIVTASNIALFVFAGFMTAVSMMGTEYQGPALKDVGVSVFWLGIVTSAGSLVGALLGLMTDALNKLKPHVFYLIDVLVVGLCMMFAGLTREPVVMALSFILFVGYGRIRLIVIQSKMLEDMKHHYKATLLSALGWFTQFAQLAVVAVLGWAIGQHGYNNGYVLFGIFTLFVGFMLWLPVARLHRVPDGIGTTSIF